MKNMFGQEIKFLLENGLNPKLSILVEEDEKPEDLPGEDIFDAADQEEAAAKEQEVAPEPDDSDDSGDDNLFGGGDEDDESPAGEGKEVPEQGESDESEITKQQLSDLEEKLGKVASAIEKASSDAGIGAVQDNISAFINASVNEAKSYSYSNKSIKMFLSEDADPDDLEKDIDALDRVLSKGTDLVDKFTKGQEVDIEKYVDAAINAYRNFDNLFAKEKIVKQAAINVLVLNSGAKADQNIKEFENLFHEELYKQFGIDYEEFALNSDHKYETGVGAVKQG